MCVESLQHCRQRVVPKRKEYIADIYLEHVQIRKITEKVEVKEAKTMPNEIEEIVIAVLFYYALPKRNDDGDC